jgi:hypothetical protein
VHHIHVVQHSKINLPKDCLGSSAADSTTVETLERRADELEDKIGPEFVKFMDALDEADEKSAEGKELMAALDNLDDLCPDK